MFNSRQIDLYELGVYFVQVETCLAAENIASHDSAHFNMRARLRKTLPRLGDAVNRTTMTKRARTAASQFEPLLCSNVDLETATTSLRRGPLRTLRQEMDRFINQLAVVDERSTAWYALGREISSGKIHLDNNSPSWKLLDTQRVTGLLRQLRIEMASIFPWEESFTVDELVHLFPFPPPELAGWAVIELGIQGLRSLADATPVRDGQDFATAERDAFIYGSRRDGVATKTIGLAIKNNARWGGELSAWRIREIADEYADRHGLPRIRQRSGRRKKVAM